MRLIKFVTHNEPIPCVGVVQDDRVISIARGARSLSELLHASDVEDGVRRRVDAGPSFKLDEIRVLAPNR